MTKPSPVRRETIYFCFADPTGFSGQKAAMELVLNGLTGRGWRCWRLPQPFFGDSGNGRWKSVRHFLRLLAAWVRALRLLGARGAWLWVGLGQTRAAFLRDAIPLLLGRIGLGRARVVVSLNGSVFMLWRNDSLEGRVFRFLLNNAGTVTVVGERQRARLLALGIPDDRVAIVVNSCDLKQVSANAVAAKHSPPGDAQRAVHCLFLSSLIDTKGFPEFLEALQRMSAFPGPPIDAILCGRVIASEFSSRFHDAASAESWIEGQLTEINRTARVRVRWIKGAVGADKAALFRTTEIFVLPTSYAVEAQPLVLLEAMASGCAIITTRAGEIPTILDESCAVLLESPRADVLTTALQALSVNAVARGGLARAAHMRFAERYQPERHLDAWEMLLDEAGRFRKDAA